MTGGGITDVPGIRVGHHSDRDAATGCTVVLCEAGAVGGVDVRGSAPGTRETDLLRPTMSVNEVHALVLSGGSAFGLDAASGAVRYLEKKGIGYQAGPARVPIVPAAVLFDLGVVTDEVRPGPEDGYAACRNASDGPVEDGSVGAGTGATVAKLLGLERAIKGGVGTYSMALESGVVVGALVAVNAVGGVFDPDDGTLIAGPRTADNSAMRNPLDLIASSDFEVSTTATATNTTIGVIATNATLTKEHANKLASVAHDGIAMAVRPAHTMCDGDTMFVIGTGSVDGPVDMLRVCAAATVCVSRAIVRAVRSAEGIGGIPSVSELR